MPFMHTKQAMVCAWLKFCACEFLGKLHIEEAGLSEWSILEEYSDAVAHNTHD